MGRVAALAGAGVPLPRENDPNASRETVHGMARRGDGTPDRRSRRIA